MQLESLQVSSLILIGICNEINKISDWHQVPNPVRRPSRMSLLTQVTQVKPFTDSLLLGLPFSIFSSAYPGLFKGSDSVPRALKGLTPPSPSPAPAVLPATQTYTFPDSSLEPLSAVETNKDKDQWLFTTAHKQDRQHQSLGWRLTHFVIWGAIAWWMSFTPVSGHWGLSMNSPPLPPAADMGEAYCTVTPTLSLKHD